MAQEIEDVIRGLRTPASPGEALGRMAEIDERLALLVVPYEEWEVLYRQRLQVERDLLREGTVTPAQERAEDPDEQEGAIARALRSVADKIG